MAFKSFLILIYIKCGGENKNGKRKNSKPKKKEVEELAEKFKKAKLVLLTDYKGISVEDVTKN